MYSWLFQRAWHSSCWKIKNSYYKLRISENYFTFLSRHSKKLMNGWRVVTPISTYLYFSLRLFKEFQGSEDDVIALVYFFFSKCFWFLYDFLFWSSFSLRLIGLKFERRLDIRTILMCYCANVHCEGKKFPFGMLYRRVTSTSAKQSC